MLSDVLCFAVVFLDSLADEILIGVLRRSFNVKSSSARIAAGTCYACSSVSFAWEIVRDSPMINIVSQTMNNDNSLS